MERIYIYGVDNDWQSLDIDYSPKCKELSITTWNDGCDAYGASIHLSRDEAFELYQSLRDFFESEGSNA